MLADSSNRPTLTIAVVGSGPRGISVLERLAVRLADGELADHSVRIHVIDATEPGAGRIWRTDQDEWFTMNTVVGQITMYSGVPDEGPARPGAGPSLGEWIAQRATTHGEPLLGADDYASRRRYGQYLRSVHRTITDHLPANVELSEIRGSVTSVVAGSHGGYALELDRSPYLIDADKVLIATGHPQNAPDPQEAELLDFAERHPGTTYLCGDSAADMPLAVEDIAPGSTVGIRGMGLSFYDVMLSLTVGRGGGFSRTRDGRLRYVPSGLEPKIVTGSRSGLPIPARGRNQKLPDHTFTPRHLTKEAVAAARERRYAATGTDRLRFNEDVLPLLLKDLDDVYRAAHTASGSTEPLPPLDLWALARPFRDARFDSPAAFRDRLLDVIREDLAQAALGNVEGPLKAALDVLRDIRNVVREAVDFGGLHPDSHTDEFQRDFVPVNALLSAGPPIERVEQLVALIESGVVEVAGPATRFTADEAGGRFRIGSPQVAGSEHSAETLIDARIPTPNLHRDVSPLTRSLIAEGLVSEFVHEDPLSGRSRATGGLNVTMAPFHAISAEGTVRYGLYALGIPTEHARWFTQVGSGKPGLNTLFRQDADAIALDMLRSARGASRTELATLSAGRAS
ncbi:FAD/NAD(P)-binding protein [Streptomyces durmitorensis]|uniref:FAD/NAD(P)-binding protein n=1 Tax=Streptomyces durmitorensis TaxID=319947 RepID=A0ABY4PLW9_9ACTN|nr:FAD/NAD(P)-binding protein [Streptomyces durmitorensis]UQT54797.1 FAD/NAD(P)-binding protein [Streptomyces durmitorensis]